MTDAAPIQIALLVEEEFEDRDLLEPLAALKAAGLDAVLVGPFAERTYTGRGGTQVTTAFAAGKVRMRQFAALVIPGGHAPDRLRMRHAMVDLARDAMAEGKPVAAIGHGAQLLISANALRGRTLTCWPSIAIDVKNAGGLYVDRPVTRDGSLITARKSDDLPVFITALLDALGRA